VTRRRIRVLGDPRFDSVVHRVSAVSATDPLLRFGRGAPTMVAGSTWPADETILLRAFGRLHQDRPDARLILVPHEPSSNHLERVERTARSAGLPPPVRLSAAERPSTLLLVDRVGVLAALYGAGTMAFVGGGFGRTGLHSVLEPAAWALPVSFGPHWRNSRDATLLLEVGAAVALPQGRREASVGALHKQWESWIVDEGSRRAQGKRARAVVEQGMGASDRSAEMLAGLISARHPRKSPREGRSDRP
jgi:3-deoxy-D-manno-octulosonic-acid transferase